MNKPPNDQDLLPFKVWTLIALGLVLFWAWACYGLTKLLPQ